MTPQVVHFIFQCAVCVGGIRRNCASTQGSLDIVDNIGRVVDITNTRGRGGAEVGRSSGGGSGRISTGV